jgi:hypothetical protein
MTRNGKHEIITRIAGPGLVLAALFALVLSNSNAGRAQSSAASPTTKAAAPAPLARTFESPVPALAQTATTAAKPSGNRMHEGITVHGHWTIEVRNPDGKLASHTEFENSLVQTSGVSMLADILLGVVVPGGYVVQVGTSTTTGGPCATVALTDNCNLVGSLVSPEPATFGDNWTECGGTGFKNQITATGPCFPLSIGVSSNNGSTGPLGLLFSGTAVASTTAAFPASITDVYLLPITCPTTQGLFTAIPGTAATSPNACATSGQGWQFLTLTHASLPTPVTVSAAGQLISVNVQISFQ